LDEIRLAEWFFRCKKYFRLAEENTGGGGGGGGYRRAMSCSGSALSEPHNAAYQEFFYLLIRHLSHFQ